MTKIIIAGSRTFNDYEFLKIELNNITRHINDHADIISGGANGADKLGERYCKEYLSSNAKVFKPNWKDGKKAGPIRNQKMAEYACEKSDDIGICICFWDGKSKGTKNMIKNAIKYRLELHVFFFGPKSMGDNNLDLF